MVEAEKLVGLEQLLGVAVDMEVGVGSILVRERRWVSDDFISEFSKTLRLNFSTTYQLTAIGEPAMIGRVASTKLRFVNMPFILSEVLVPRLFGLVGYFFAAGLPACFRSLHCGESESYIKSMKFKAMWFSLREYFRGALSMLVVSQCALPSVAAEMLWIQKISLSGEVDILRSTLATKNLINWIDVDPDRWVLKRGRGDSTQNFVARNIHEPVFCNNFTFMKGL